MRLTGFTDYSLRVLIYLASEPGRRATIAQIAETFAVKENHLTKVVHFLGRIGVLANVRGKGGGLELALPADQIIIGHVVRETEGADVVAECFGDTPNSCSIARICRLRGVLAEALAAFYGVLDRYTLADLVHNRDSLARVLFVGEAARPKRQPAA